MKHVKPPIIPEAVIHMAVVEHLHTYAKPGVVFWHTPNGGKRSAQWAAKLKHMGLLPGVSDIVLLYREPGSNHANFYALELKASNGRPTEPQLAFIAAVEKQGGFGCICHSIDAAVRALKLWGLML